LLAPLVSAGKLLVVGLVLAVAGAVGLGVTTHPTGAGAAQAARNALMDPSERASRSNTSSTTATARSPPSSTRFRSEGIDKIPILHKEHARRMPTEWPHHYTHARPHRGLGQLTPDQTEHGWPAPINLAEHRVRLRAVLGATTHEHRAATAA
jgi:hypothetical protein